MYALSSGRRPSRRCHRWLRSSSSSERVGAGFCSEARERARSRVCARGAEAGSTQREAGASWGWRRCGGYEEWIVVAFAPCSPRVALLNVVLVLTRQRRQRRCQEDCKEQRHDAALELSGHCGGRRAIVSAGLAAVTSSAPLAAIAASRENLDSVSTQTPLPAEAPSGEQQFVTLPSGLKYKEIKKGSGDVVRQGDTVAIQYTGRLLNLNGKKFASTFDGVAPGGLPEPLVFTVGEREVIPGLEELVLGMSKGGYRRGLVPPALGYDQAISLGPKPANFQDARSLDAVVKNPNRDATLIWDVQLERVRRK